MFYVNPFLAFSTVYVPLLMNGRQIVYPQHTRDLTLACLYCGFVIILCEIYAPSVIIPTPTYILNRSLQFIFKSKSKRNGALVCTNSYPCKYICST